MNQTKTSPTMKDVAQEAGVSLGTVSKVVNGISVGEEYYRRVQAAIEKLDYRINSYAKGLKSNKTFTIAVMVPNLINPFFSQLVDAINRELAAKNYRMLFYATDYDPKLEQRLVQLAEQQKVDGIICLSYNPELKVSEGVPFVSIDRYFGGNIPCVSADNYGGGRLAAEKLAENGCRNVAFMRVGSHLTNEPNKRKDGFVSGCEALGIPCTLKITGDDTPISVFEDFLREHFRDGKLEFDGIFCVTDYLAHQIIGILSSMGLQVPEDVQVIGFDGIRAFGDQELTCSTIIQPIEAIASSCVEMVLGTQLIKAPSLLCLPISYGFGGTTKA
ncbi:MAG: LacI family DNA-binding transcriptional regulator [Lachnospiraceae bacterium]|nr:LacI family DNA-binding transcriptional regulator [Lachnospiraceae bacterium]